jgi:hypothetical protein
MKDEGQKGKAALGLVQECVSVGGGSTKGEGKDSKYGGCILYFCMKIE